MAEILETGPRGIGRLGRALRHPAFRFFFAGQAVSLTGTWVQSVAQSWLVYRLTGSPLLLGTVVFAGQLPVFLLSALAGALADRWPKRRLIVVTQAIQMMLAALLAGLTLSGLVTVPMVMAVAALSGIVQAIDVPARQSFVVEMVGRDDLPNAIALNSSLFIGARMVGPALGGLIVAWVGEGWCFAINAVSFAAVILGLLVMPLVGPPAAAGTTRGLAALAEGLRYAWGEAAVRKLLLLVGWTSLVGMPYTTLLPVFAALKHGGGPATLGALMASAGGGALAGALTLAFLGRAPRIAVPGLAAGAFGTMLALFALCDLYPLALACLALAGFSLMIEVGSANIIVQTTVPDALRGRVMALYATMFLGMAPFGGLFIGALAEALGVVAATAIGGMLTALAGVTLVTSSRRKPML